MTQAGERPSLLRWSRFAVTWHVATWVGWGLVLLAAARVGAPQSNQSAFWLIAALVVGGELRPVRTAGPNDPAETVTSSTFVFAALYLWGPWAAILLQALATAVSELAKHKPLWKLTFNVGQFVVSLAAAWGVMCLAGLPHGVLNSGGGIHHLDGSDLVWMVATWAVWFAVNNALVSGLSQDVHQTFWEAFTEDFGYYLLTTAAVLSLAPLVVFAALHSAWYVPLMVIPLVAVHKTARISMVEQANALHDSLTGLPNRKYVHQRLHQALDAPVRDPFALVMLDLDRFKEVNDTLGHHVGDQLLVLVAARLREVLRPDDVVARLGGDEFALFLPAVPTATAAVEVGQRVRQALADPFTLDDVVLEIEASVGIALSPQHSVDVEELFRCADVAMYTAKEDRTDMELYDPTTDRHSTDRLGLLASLRHAIDNRELELHYQPKVGLADGRIRGMEALLRWTHPIRGPIPPDEFIPLAETSGLMHRLTAFVVDEALHQVAVWRREGFTVAVAVNISAKDLHGVELSRTVSEALARHRVPAYLLKLELTERTLMAENSRVADTLTALEALDIELSLDDFGSGYSSMFMLKRLPVSEIKVDRSFVSQLGDGGGDASIVRSIIDLAHGLGMMAVAEGVETLEVWDRLALLGCDHAQGWYVARPMSATKATEWLAAHYDEENDDSAAALPAPLSGREPA